MTKLMNEAVNSSIPKLTWPGAVDLLPLMLENGDVPTFRVAKGKVEGIEGSHVVVEEMKYSGNVADETVARTLFDRMVHLLGVQNRPTVDFRALRCRGFYHETKHSFFGLVYDFPDPPRSAKVEVVQLSRLIKDHPALVSSRDDLIITLNERYRLAHDLAAAVYAFHQVGWLHKNISSYNVIFFREERKEGKIGKPKEPQAGYTSFSRLSLASPFLIGFSHARPNEEGQYSNKTSTEVGDKATRTLQSYHHPGYYGTDNRRTPYRTAYDYYSLGLILLEIGSWQSLGELLYRGKEDLDRLQKAEHLRRRRVPALAASMGDVYAAAVGACLDDAVLRSDVSSSSSGGGNSGPGSDTTAERLAVDRNFERLVLTPLEALAKGFRTNVLHPGD
ncbi:hypothetical protein BDZ45DRAFT_677781 [Acephala macrosclerotiorum]|nr:hypothetical protein BDZ45DRAFT_677781 [Acephala macrosclerotiorum]